MSEHLSVRSDYGTLEFEAKPEWIDAIMPMVDLGPIDTSPLAWECCGTGCDRLTGNPPDDDGQAVCDRCLATEQRGRDWMREHGPEPTPLESTGE